VRATQRPVAIAEHRFSRAVADRFGQGHHLPDVPLPDPVRCLRALQVALLHLVLAPEIQGKDGHCEEGRPAQKATSRRGAPIVTAAAAVLNLRRYCQTRTVNRRSLAGVEPEAAAVLDVDDVFRPAA